MCFLQKRETSSSVHPTSKRAILAYVYPEDNQDFTFSNVNTSCLNIPLELSSKRFKASCSRNIYLRVDRRLRLLRLDLCVFLRLPPFLVGGGEPNAARRLSNDAIVLSASVGTGLNRLDKFSLT